MLGQNSMGQLGTGNDMATANPIRVGSDNDWLSVGSGYGFSCGVRNKSVYCWGDNGKGQIGDGTTDNRNQPTAISSL